MSLKISPAGPGAGWARPHVDASKPRGGYTVLDVLTPLSDCRHETVEKIMERRISGVSYMCWIDFHNGIWGCGFLCARLITLYFVSILSLFCLSFRLPRRGLSRPFLTTTGYHACVYIPVTTPELSRSTNTRTSGYHTRY